MSDLTKQLSPNDEADASQAPGTITLTTDHAKRDEAFNSTENHRNEKGEQAKPVRIMSSKVSNPHEAHCFVVMPYGRSPAEVRWFRGWYNVVIEQAVTSAGYMPILSATEERPNAINDEIRAHLSFDPMVVVDLGGFEPDADPNPNVMYELGIRHALSLPLVMMAWQN